MLFTESEMKSIARDKIVAAAEACHNANMKIREEIGEDAISWEESSDEVRQSAISGVEKVLNNPQITAEDIHAEWMAYKAKQGWRYGEERDEALKTHPGMIAFDKLSDEDKRKDTLFIETAKGLLF